MKLFKKIAAMGAAVVMAVSMMSVGASAASSPDYSWSIGSYTAPGMPSNTPAYTQVSRKYENTFGATMYYFTSKCTSYSSGEDSNGRTAYVRYWCYVTKLDGTVTGGTSSKYHYQVSSSGTKSNINTAFKYGTYAYVKYVVNKNSDENIVASMSGIYNFSN